MASNPNRVGQRGTIPWRLLGWGVAAALLLLPLIAMQFTTEVNWTASDFAFAAIVFGMVGGTFEFAVRKSEKRAYRAGAAVALAAAFLTVWINAAVGVIGSEDNPANLMFFAVLAIAVGGAIWSRFAPSGMARAMTITAAAQAIVGAITLVRRLGENEPPGIIGVEMIIGVFTLMWLLSAWLFRKAASQ